MTTEPQDRAIPQVTESLNPGESGLAVPLSEPVPFVLDDAPEDEEQGKKIEAAYSVPVFHWKDKALAPFAIDREGDWMRHRTILGEPQLYAVISQPEAMLPDALRVLWFLSVEPDEWLSVPAMKHTEEGWILRSPHERAMEVEMKIRKWAAENVCGSEGPLAVNLFYDIFQSAHSTKAVARPSEHQREDRAKN